MDDKIEATRERVEECARLVNELLDEYGCSIRANVTGADAVLFNNDDFPYHEVEL